MNAACTETIPRLNAVQYVTPMSGGAQSHLMVCSDGELYVVKCADNPQGAIILANEFLAAQIAGLLELPVPHPAVINITPEFLTHSPKLRFRRPRAAVDCAPGFAFGSRYQANVFKGDRDLIIAPQEHLPSSQFCLVENRDDFMGMLVFDKWTCNCDGRQVIYVLGEHLGAYRVYMIDNGFCFGGVEWDFPDSPVRGLYSNREVYQKGMNVSALNPWLERLEQIRFSDLQGCTDNLPSEWYARDLTRLDRLLDKLNRRRQYVRELVINTLAYERELGTWSSVPPQQLTTVGGRSKRYRT